MLHPTFTQSLCNKLRPKPHFNSGNSPFSNLPSRNSQLSAFFCLPFSQADRLPGPRWRLHLRLILLHLTFLLRLPSLSFYSSAISIALAPAGYWSPPLLCVAGGNVHPFPRSIQCVIENMLVKSLVILIINDALYFSLRFVIWARSAFEFPWP
jgi:hypothetical protein